MIPSHSIAAVIVFAYCAVVLPFDHAYVLSTLSLTPSSTTPFISIALLYYVLLSFGYDQGLQALAGIAFATVKQWDKEFVDKSDENFKVRESSCPLEYSQKLLNPGDYLSDDMREMMMGEDDGM